VAAFLLLASCAKEPEPSGSGIQMLLAPTLAGDTKGSLTTADLTDFYLQVVSDDTAFSYFEHASKNGSGIWTTPAPLLWKNEQASVSYAAARFGDHAFKADEFKNGLELELPVDQSTQVLLNSADLLTMAASTVKYEDTTDGTLPVTLSHGLARLTITLTLGPKFYENVYTCGENPVKDFTIGGTNACFNFKPQTGAVTVTADTPAYILPMAGTFNRATAEVQSATATYEAILVPQTIEAGSLNVSFTVGSLDYNWSNATSVTLEAGKTYDLAVSVTTAPLPLPPALGDLFYSDGTWSPKLLKGKTPIGVIAYLGTDVFTETGTIIGGAPFEGHGLVLCLKNAAVNPKWSTEKVSRFPGQEVTNVAGLKRTTNVSGYTNTATLTVDNETAAKYPAAAAAKNYTALPTPAGTTGWFLPSIQQWLKIIEGLGGLVDSAPNYEESWFDNDHTSIDNIEAALAKTGTAGTDYDSMMSYMWYWSSTEYSADNTVDLGVRASGKGSGYGLYWSDVSKTYKSNNVRSRPVLAF
jgi:hypothetical protein